MPIVCCSLLSSYAGFSNTWELEAAPIPSRFRPGCNGWIRYFERYWALKRDSLDGTSGFRLDFRQYAMPRKQSKRKRFSLPEGAAVQLLNGSPEWELNP